MAKEEYVRGGACSNVYGNEHNYECYFTFPQEGKITGVFIFTFAIKVK